eukprot:scaffold7626_cov134-Isochrysis_galbana.AAC.1
MGAAALRPWGCRVCSSVVCACVPSSDAWPSGGRAARFERRSVAGPRVSSACFHESARLTTTTTPFTTTASAVYHNPLRRTELIPEQFVAFKWRPMDGRFLLLVLVLGFAVRAFVPSLFARKKPRQL